MLSSAVILSLASCARAAVGLDYSRNRHPPQQVHVVAPDGVLPPAYAFDADADGSRSAPFRSVTAARDALREMQRLPPGGVEVHLHGGTHAPFLLDGTADSGRADAPIVYTAAPGENALVSGGLPIPGKAFKAWSTGPPGVLRADLSALGVTRELLGGMQTASMKCVGDCQHDKSELFLDGKAMTLARFPNKNAAGGWEFLKADIGGNFGRISAKTGGPWFLMKAGPNASRIAAWANGDLNQHNSWLHGYWSKDWADCYRKLLSAIPVTVNGTSYINVSFEAQTHNDDNVDTHARFYGVNILSELDDEGEYFISEEELLLYFKPPAGSEPSEWVGATAPVLSVNASAVITLNNVSHVQLKDLTVAYGRANGVAMSDVTNVHAENCTVFGLGQDGMTLSGQDSSVSRSSISDCGCKGLTTSGGNPAQLKPGNLEIIENTIEKVAQWKRTYQPPIAFSGSGNVYRGNRVGQVPHTCITGGGTNLSFSENVIDTCAFESSDVGAFYTCGQGGRAFWSGRGSKVFNNTFKNIRNTAGTGVQSASVQALYLDDEMSGWEVYENRFINCQAGTFIGGGRDNSFHDNYYEDCDKAHHFDDRGLGWQNYGCNCTGPISATSPCNPAAAWAVVQDKANAKLVAAFPDIKTSVLPAHGGKHMCVPVNNRIENNRFCRCKVYADVTQQQVNKWLSFMRNNTEHCADA